jgi:PIN domain nuclease of toxin-antitoxin system
MKYLLDTHAFLWSIADTKQLPKKVKSEIKKEENEVFVSAISIWEIVIKMRLKKLELKGIMVEELGEVIEKMDFQTIPMSLEDSIGYYNLAEESHKDPFDRMLIWQCISRNLTLISKDSEFKKFVPLGLKLLWE